MARRVCVVAAALLMAVAGSAVYAITNGQPDGNGHPYVAMLVFTDGADYWQCSGALIAPSTVLTAGHCTQGATRVGLSFAAKPEALPYVSTSIYTNPNLCLGCGPGLVGLDRSDVGLVSLNSSVTHIVPAALPTANLVDTLSARTAVDIVGYGVRSQTRGDGPPVWEGNGERYFAPTLLLAGKDRISDTFIKLAANPSQGKGGICFGDSGGPDLLGGTNTILAVNSFVGNGNCAGVTYSQRIDLPEILAWISSIAQ